MVENTHEQLLLRTPLPCRPLPRPMMPEATYHPPSSLPAAAAAAATRPTPARPTPVPTPVPPHAVRPQRDTWRDTGSLCFLPRKPGMPLRAGTLPWLTRRRPENALHRARPLKVHPLLALVRALVLVRRSCAFQAERSAWRP